MNSGTLAPHVVGALIVGQVVNSEWAAGGFPVNQGWGPSSYGGEPEGHGYAHWHAGVDLGLPCGTTVLMPRGTLGVARWVDNPGGYGTALRIEVYTAQPDPKGAPVIVRRRTWDVWLGHLRQRLVSDGQQLKGGEHLAISNNTGNSTGCHLHFEVRPAGGKYGTDVDPSTMLTAASTDNSITDVSGANSDGNPYNPLDPRYSLWELEHQLSGGITQAENVLLGVGQAGLGTVMLLGGLVIVTFGLKGKTGAQLGASVRTTVSKVRRQGAASTYRQESAQQGAIARDVAEQTAEQRAAGAQAAGERMATVRKYRAGLISRQEAQRRLGEPVRATGKRPKRVAYGGQGIRKPGVYRGKGGTVDLKDPRAAARRSRVRVSHQRDFAMPDLGDGGAPF